MAPVSFDVGSLGTILGVWAHPDDETYSMGGIMAAAVDNGQRVACITATRGEGGSQDPDRWPPETLGEVREKELAEAFAILGVREHHFLGYPDGGCATVDREQAVAAVAEIMADVQPDSVLCFASDGGTWHTDHIASHDWATEAFRRVAKPGARLFYAVNTPELWEFLGRLVPVEAVMMDDRPMVMTPRAECDILTDWEGQVRERKLQALLAQVSQTESMVAMMGIDMFRNLLGEESYVLAAVAGGSGDTA